MPTSSISGRKAAARSRRRPAEPGPPGAWPWGPGTEAICRFWVGVAVTGTNLGQTQVYVKTNSCARPNLRLGWWRGTRTARTAQAGDPAGDLRHRDPDVRDELLPAQGGPGLRPRRGGGAAPGRRYWRPGARREHARRDPPRLCRGRHQGRRHARAFQPGLRRDDPQQPGAGRPGTGDAGPARAGARRRHRRRDRTDNPQQRLVAALLASVHRVLAAEATQRSLAGQPREEICALLADAATRAFDLLEPSLGSYGIRAQPG